MVYAKTLPGRDKYFHCTINSTPVEEYFPRRYFPSWYWMIGSMFGIHDARLLSDNQRCHAAFLLAIKNTLPTETTGLKDIVSVVAKYLQ